MSTHDTGAHMSHHEPSDAVPGANVRALTEVRNDAEDAGRPLEKFSVCRTADPAEATGFAQETRPCTQGRNRPPSAAPNRCFGQAARIGDARPVRVPCATGQADRISAV